jgi:hypothetical protein
MKLKGLAKAIGDLKKLQEVIQESLDNNDLETDAEFARDERDNDAYMAIDEAITALMTIYEMKLEDY